MKSEEEYFVTCEKLHEIQIPMAKHILSPSNHQVIHSFFLKKIYAFFGFFLWSLAMEFESVGRSSSGCIPSLSLQVSFVLSELSCWVSVACSICHMVLNGVPYSRAHLPPIHQHLEP